MMQPNPSSLKGARGLTPVQEQAALRLATGFGTCQLAKELGFHRATVSAWKKKPAFQTAVRRFQTEASKSLKDRLLQGIGRAVEVLQEIMDSPSTSGHEKVAAARTILSTSTAHLDRILAAREPKSPSWENIVRETAVKSMQLCGAYDDATYVLHAGTAGTAWARTDLTREMFEKLKKHRNDPVATQALCDRYLRELENTIDEIVFERRERKRVEATSIQASRNEKLRGIDEAFESLRAMTQHSNSSETKPV